MRLFVLGLAWFTFVAEGQALIHVAGKPPDLSAPPVIHCAENNRVSQLISRDNSEDPSDHDEATADADSGTFYSFKLDTAIIDDLRTALRAAGEPDTPKLIILVDQTDQDEQSEANELAQWPLVAPPTEIPNYFIAPPPDDLVADVSQESEEESAEQDPGDERTIIQQELPRWLLQASQAIAAGACTDVDLSSRPFRSSCELLVEDVSIHLAWDVAGHGYLLVTLLAETVDDLRSAQRAHNDRVLRYIESLVNCGEAQLDDDIVEGSFFGLEEEQDDEPWLAFCR